MSSPGGLTVPTVDHRRPEDVARTRAMSSLSEESLQSSGSKWRKTLNIAKSVTPKRAFGKIAKARSVFAENFDVFKSGPRQQTQEEIFGHERKPSEKGKVMSRLGGDMFFGALDTSLVEESDRQHKHHLFHQETPGEQRQRLRTMTISTAGLENDLRKPKHTLDESYISVVHSIIGQGGINDTRALDFIRRLYNIDATSHEGCIRQYSTIPNMLAAGTALLLENIEVEDLPESMGKSDEFFCTAQVLQLVPRSRGSVRDIDRKLHKCVSRAVKASGKSLESDMKKIEALLKSGADPNITVSTKPNSMNAIQYALDANSAPLIGLLHEFGGSTGSGRSSTQFVQTETSSGTVESVPIKVENMPKAFPDQFVLPLKNQGSSAVVNVEVWRLLKSADRVSEASIISSRESVTSIKTTKSGLSTRKHRFFKNRRSSANTSNTSDERSVVADKGGNEMILIGSVSMDLATLPMECSLKRTLPLILNGVEQPTTVKYMLKVTKEFIEIKENVRRNHRDLVHRVHLDLLRKVPKHVPLRYWEMYDSDSATIHRGIINLHAKWAYLTPEEQAVDKFCAILELHADPRLSSEGGFTHKLPAGLVPGDLHRAVVECLQACRGGKKAQRGEKNGPLLLSQNDIVRIVAALDCAKVYCMEYASQPQKYFAEIPEDLLKCDTEESNGVEEVDLEFWPIDELGHCVKTLNQIYNVSEWEVYSIRDDDQSETSACIISDRSASKYLMNEAVQLMQANQNIGYIRLKALLVQRFGEEEFDRSKHAIHRLLQNSLDFTVNPDLKEEGSIMARFEELLMEDQNITYSKIKSVLTKEYGEKNFANHHRTISTLLISHLNKKVASVAENTEKRSLVQELNTRLEGFVKTVYMRLKDTCQSTIEDQIQRGLVTLIRVMALQKTELRQFYELYHEQYVSIPNYSFFGNWSQWTDKLVSTDLGLQMYLWNKEVKGQNFPIIFFNLLQSTRDLWDSIEILLKESNSNFKPDDYRLADYKNWYYEITCEFMQKCESAAVDMVKRSLGFETWVPETKRNILQSTRDLLVVVNGLQDAFAKIDWPDPEVKVEVLFNYLCAAACTATETYVKLISNIDNIAAENNRDNSFEEFTFDGNSAIILKLNSLDHIVCTLANIREYMQVDNATEQHKLVAAKNSTKPDQKPRELKGVIRFRRTEEFVKHTIFSIGQKIGEMMAIRIENDINIGYKRLAQILANKERVAVTDIVNDTLNGLLIDHDDTEKFTEATTHTEYMEEKKNLRERIIARLDRNKSRSSEIKQDGYLSCNLVILATECEVRCTMEKVVSCIFIEYCRVLKHKLVETIGIMEGKWNDQDREIVLDFTRQLKEQMVNYLHDEGEGVPLDGLNESWGLVVEPIVNMCLKSSADIEKSFYLQAAIGQSDAITENIGEGRVSCSAGEGTFKSIADKKLVNIVKLSNATDSSRKGVLAMRFKHASNTRDIRVCILEAVEVDKEKELFFTAKARPEYPGCLNYKSSVSKGSMWEDTSFTLQEQEVGNAVEIRVYIKPKSMVSQPELVGEIILDVQTVLGVGDSAEAFFPVRTKYPDEGLLVPLMQLMKPRSDKVAKQFIKRIEKLATP